MSDEKKQTKDKFEWLKNLGFLKKLKQVKHIGFIVTMIFVLILLIILFGNFNFSSSSAIKVSSSDSAYTNSVEYVQQMEDKLKNLIAKIKGTGNVEVMLTLDSGTSIVLASNDETKTTSNGNSSTTTVSANPIILKQNGNNLPVVVEEVIPKIKGVVIVSSGAKDVNVRLNILNAVQTLTGLTNSQIQILIGE